jgi:hypothetical protein
MQIKDYLNAFSVDDLRELATRRSIPVPEGARGGRQTLVRILSGALERPDGVYGTITRLNRAELGVLQAVLKGGKRAGLTALAREAKADAGLLKAVLESLRLYGLLFPEGNWEHIAIPGPSRLAIHYTPAAAGAGTLAEQVRIPTLEPAPKAACAARPGSLARDLAEMLARIARSRLRLTQAGRINKRDLKTMEPAFGVQDDGYSMFLFMLSASIPLVAHADPDILVVQDEVDVFLAQPEPLRTALTTAAWNMMRAFPESATGDPTEYDYVPANLAGQRGAMVGLFLTLEPERPVTAASLAQALVWNMPLAFTQWDGSRDSGRVTARLLRSLYWLGIVALDDPRNPKSASVTPLGARMLHLDAPDGPALVPEERRFFLQPNAEIFAPPNLCPRAFFHVRRVTGEKKGAAGGVYPLTADSIRRALDTGLTTAEVVTFLERFSRTGLPSNVRSLVETVGRQHGRIRLVPAGYVLVTDEPRLLEELRHVKPVAALLGRPVAERVAAVDDAQVTPLLRALRQKGYAPLNEAETGEAPPLPADPDTVPQIPLSELAALDGPPGDGLPGGDLPALLGPDEGDLDPAILDALEALGLEIDLPPPAFTPRDIRDLLEFACQDGMWVAIEYQEGKTAPVEKLEFCPDEVHRSTVKGYTFDEEENEVTVVVELGKIRSARLTGEMELQ